jgi:hypothetical protein
LYRRVEQSDAVEAEAATPRGRRNEYILGI